MGILDYVLGWKEIREKELPDEILKHLQYRTDREMYKKVKAAEKKAYRKSQGIPKPLPALSGCTVYAESPKFLYRALEPDWKWLQQEKKGRYQPAGKRQYAQKLKKKKEPQQ